MIPVNKLQRMKIVSVKDKVYAYLKKNKGNAYRPEEIIKKLKASPTTVRAGLRKLYLEGKIEKKSVAQNCSYYYYKEESKNKNNKK